MSDENGQEFFDLEDPDFHKVGKSVTGELLKRLTEDPGSLSATAIEKIFSNYHKALEKGMREPEAVKEYISVRTILLNLDLEPSRKKELLLVELARLDEERELVINELEDM